MMTTTKFQSHLRAGYPALFFQTHEERRTLRILYRESGEKACFTWDIVTGLTELSTGSRIDKNPLEAAASILQLPENSVLFLLDFHPYLKNPEIIRTLKNCIPEMKNTGRHVVMISPRLEIPAELEKQITVLDVPLPDVDELTEIAESMIKTAGIDVVVDPSVIGKAKGLTTLEAEDAFARSLVETGTLDGKTIADAKAQSWKKAGHELYEPEPLESLQGLDQLKTYIQSRKTGFANDKIPNPKGILLTGPPGTGKSLSAKVISSVLDFPLVRIDPTAISGSLVGESQQKTKDLWKMIKALSPCVVWIDEIEKMFGGVQSSGRTDGGTGAAVFGMFLTEMQEIREPVYIVATCNDIDQLLTISQGALLRRFDDVFFMDLPTESERKGILEYMVAKYGAEISADGIAALVAQTAGWTGAEIEKAVIANHYENDAFARMHPVYQQNKDNIDRARAWSRTNARRANAEETTTTNGNNNRRLAI